MYINIDQRNYFDLNEIVSLIYQSSLPRLSTLRSFLEHSLMYINIYIILYYICAQVQSTQELSTVLPTVKLNL